ncbi:MAG: hypothetical protein M3Z75_13400 [Actinomycetota bacterium]|nr:hypothetical protein [Actinomycetota bacterium]
MRASPGPPLHRGCPGHRRRRRPDPAPVTGHAAAAPGVAGTIATISRTNGSAQVTYDGHPLYTYVGDNAPGQDSGNKLNLNGGVWLDVPATPAG